MKQIAQYKVNFESGWIVGSSALMGLAFFCQMLCCFAFRLPQEIGIGTMVLFLILPGLLEIAWVLLLRCVKRNAPGVYGILGCVFCLILAIQVCASSGVVYMVLAMIAYLLCCGLLVMITGGFMPYKYFGLLGFAVLLAIRVIKSGILGAIFRLELMKLAEQLPGICILAALMLFFGGISAVRLRK